MQPEEQFIGPKKVLGIVKEAFTTEGGNEVVTVHYENGQKETMPFAAFADLVTPKASDFTELSKKRINTLVLRALKMVSEYDLKSGEIDSFGNSLKNELFNQINRATSYLWTHDDKQFVPGFNIVMDRSILEAQMVIRNDVASAPVAPAPDAQPSHEQPTEQGTNSEAAPQ